MKKPFVCLLAALALLPNGPAGAWGFFGHRTITQVAVYELPASMQAFYFRHMPELVAQSTAPDERRNDDPTEGPKHFIDMDHYSEDNPFGKMPRQYDQAVEKYSADTLKKYGTVPWTIMEMKDELTEAFRQQDTLAIIKYSAELSHYLSDAFVPLHTTINYDGQLTNQKGLHSLWESQLPEKFIGDYKLVGDDARYIKKPLDAIWEVIQGSYGFLGETFDRATKLEKTMPPATRFTYSHRYGKTQRRYSNAFAAAYEKEVGGMVNFRLKGAASEVASMWLTAWQEAGKPNLDKLMTPAQANQGGKGKADRRAGLVEEKHAGSGPAAAGPAEAEKSRRPRRNKGRQGHCPRCPRSPRPNRPPTLVPDKSLPEVLGADKVKLKVKTDKGSEKKKIK